MVFLSTAVLLSSCASTQPKPTISNQVSQANNEQHLQKIVTITQFTLKGRIGVQTKEQGFSGGLNWQHNANQDNIALFSPLGGQVASIYKSSGMVTLEDANGHSISANDAETLTQSVLGWKLPLAGLVNWSLGRPNQSPILAISWDEQGHLSTLKQDGWEIEYENYAQQGDYFLPNKIVLRNEKVNLKLLVKSWEDLGS